MIFILVVDGVAAGVAALVVLGPLAMSMPGLFTRVEPLAAAWCIVVALTALRLAQAALRVPFAWRRGLGELVSSGRVVQHHALARVVGANEVRQVFERVAAVGIVLARELDGPAGAVVLVTIVTAGALVAANVLWRYGLRRWNRRRQRQLARYGR